MFVEAREMKLLTRNFRFFLSFVLNVSLGFRMFYQKLTEIRHYEMCIDQNIVKWKQHVSFKPGLDEIEMKWLEIETKQEKPHNLNNNNNNNNNEKQPPSPIKKEIHKG